MIAVGWPQLFMLLSLLAVSKPSVAQVLGDVFIYTNNYTFDPFPDLPADFGPEIPDEGIDGLLRVADPEDACQPFKYHNTRETWVALISRSQQQHPTNCTFDIKVGHAEAAGASAAIVYDDVYEALIIMSKPRDHPDPGIPAVFVSEKAGIIMKKLITPGQTRVQIVAVSASAWMSLVMSAFLGFLALTVVLATFYVMRSWSVWLGRTRGRRTAADVAGHAGQYAGIGQPPTPGGLPACAIRALPVLVYEGKPSSNRRKSSRKEGRPKDAALDRSMSMPINRAPSASEPLTAAATVDDIEQGVGASQQQGAAAVFLDDSFYSSSAPSVLPAAHRVSSITPTSNSSSLTPNAGQAGLSFPPAAAFPPAAMLAAAGDTSLMVAPEQAPAEAPSSPVSGTQSPLLSTDDDYDDSDQQGPSVTASSTGIVTGGPVGARGGATRRTCVVCLERYQAGDKIRVLPCQHRFHARCIDPWLANRRLCPVCKHDASQPALHLLPSVAGPAAAGAASAASSRPAAPGAAGLGVAGGGEDAGHPAAAMSLLMGGLRWFRRMRAQPPSQQLQQQQAQGAAADAAAGPGAVVLPTPQQPRQLRSAATYAEAAVAAADAAENGLLPPAGIRGVPPLGESGSVAASQQQLPVQQWRRQRQRSGRQSRQAFARQLDGEQGDLVTPLLAAGTNNSTGRRSRDRSVTGASANLPPLGRYAGVAGLRGALGPSIPTSPLPIPQLTPVQSDASSTGSQTPTYR